MKNEVWRKSSLFNLYEVSNFGRIRMRDDINKIKRYKTKPGDICNPWKGKNGYLQIELLCDGIRKREYVHRIVCEAFHLKSHGKNIVNHKNMNTLDNKASNLEWCSKRENSIHGLINNGGHKLSIESIKKIKNLCRSGIKRKEISELFGISKQLVSNIKTGIQWSFINA